MSDEPILQPPTLDPETDKRLREQGFTAEQRARIAVRAEQLLKVFGDPPTGPILP